MDAMKLPKPAINQIIKLFHFLLFAQFAFSLICFSESRNEFSIRQIKHQQTAINQTEQQLN